MISSSDLWAALTLPALTSLLISLAIVATERWHGRFSYDFDLSSVQKMHRRPVPRVGGIALCGGALAVVLFGASSNLHPALCAHTSDLKLLLVAGMPCFLMGLTEDLTKRVSVRARLLAGFASALLAAWLLGAWLPRLGIYGIDNMLRYGPIALIVTAVAVAGVSNAINIIDGFNGVAGGAVAIILSALAWLAFERQDMFLVTLCLTGIGAMLGFLLVNYPTGRLFMGDGGAYVAGFWVAEIAVLLVIRHSDISPWQALSICAYPVIEVLYSVYRRKIVRHASAGAPDRLHLHTLLYRRLVCSHVGRDARTPWKRNALVACIVASWITIACVLTVVIGDRPLAALNLVLLQALLYMAVYARLVRGHWRLHPLLMFGLRAEGRSGVARQYL
jgi:UDP-N-acetylmuramyl pentapeptide phosphotransferase/UDP-N-acetylglucosamine-1-phosphate transferase